ncbi:hypothetical protein [Serratia liquefaciens]|uniref:hypothetical protein n=1 Tax=Serratia liquefaciens TaxID=614 RepID=UPI00382BA7F0
MSEIAEPLQQFWGRKKLLSFSVRQLQCILIRYLVHGAAAITSRKRGKPANNRASDDIKLCVLALLREKYGDFVPTAQRKPSDNYLYGNGSPQDDC